MIQKEWNRSSENLRRNEIEQSRKETEKDEEKDLSGRKD